MPQVKLARSTLAKSVQKKQIKKQETERKAKSKKEKKIKKETVKEELKRVHLTLQAFKPIKEYSMAFIKRMRKNAFDKYEKLLKIVNSVKVTYKSTTSCDRIFIYQLTSNDDDDGGFISMINKRNIGILYDSNINGLTLEQLLVIAYQYASEEDKKILSEMNRSSLRYWLLKGGYIKLSPKENKKVTVSRCIISDDKSKQAFLLSKEEGKKILGPVIVIKNTKSLEDTNKQIKKLESKRNEMMNLLYSFEKEDNKSKKNEIKKPIKKKENEENEDNKSKNGEDNETIKDKEPKKSKKEKSDKDSKKSKKDKKIKKDKKSKKDKSTSSSHSISDNDSIKDFIDDNNSSCFSDDQSENTYDSSEDDSFIDDDENYNSGEFGSDHSSDEEDDIDNSSNSSISEKEEKHQKKDETKKRSQLSVIDIRDTHFKKQKLNESIVNINLC